MSGSDEGSRRRVGDATRQRINQLADGWKTPKSPRADEREADPGAEVEVEAEPEPPQRAISAMPEDEDTPLPELRDEGDSDVVSSGQRSPTAEVEPEQIESVDEDDLPAATASIQVEEAVADGVDAVIESSADRNDDATQLQDFDTVTHGAATKLRAPASLPRKRGWFGDVKYVFTALFGVASARRELAEVGRKLDRERAERSEALASMSSALLDDKTCVLPVVVDTRKQLEAIRLRRRQPAAAVTSAAAEIDALEEERSRAKTIAADATAELEAEFSDLRGRLAPLERDGSRVRKKATDLQVAITDVDEKIANQSAAAASARDRASAEAALAANRAERSRLVAREPVLAAEMDDFEPKIANLTADRAAVEDKISGLRQGEAEAVVRSREKIEAIRAGMAVEERTLVDADDEAAQLLLDLGESLGGDRPPQLADELAPIDEFDLFIATLERRAIELREIVDGVSRAAVARGVGVIVVVLALVGAALWVVLT